MPRFDQSFNGLREQNLQETQQLKQRYLDGKNKRVPKAKDKKQQDSIQSSVHVQQKFLKRGFDEHDPGNEGSFEPPVKLQCTTQHQGHQPDGCTTKFSVEIVQQLEFTTSAASSQPQQISTNVTVKAHTNASMKTGVPSPIPNPDTPKSTENNNGNNGQSQNVNAFAGCVKQEPEMDFADLDQCAAALEKDANGGNGFPLADLLNENTPEAAAYLQDFLFELDDIKGYIFDEKKDVEGLKVEDLKDIPSVDNSNKAVNSPLNQNYSPPVYEKNRLPYSNLDFGKTEMSPAAQTLKQMAEQHQNKNQMGLSYNPNNRTPTARSPYPEFPIADYGSPNNNFHKGNASYPQPDIIKQEMMFQGSEYETKRKGAGVYKQQYSPYGSPSASGHGSPGYLPGRGSAASNNGPTSNNSFGAGTPPRPPSGPGGANSTTTTLQINQAQQLHINQQGHGHNIQVSAGQHLHLSGDLKGNVSVAAQQAMHFSQHSSSSTNSGPNTQQQQQQQQQHHQQSQNTSPQQNNAHVPHQNHQNPNAQHANPVLSNQHPNLQSSLSGMSNPMSNQMGNSMNNSMNNPNIPSSMPTNIQSPGVGTSMHSPLSGLQGSAMGNMPNGMGMMGSNGVGSGHGAHIGGQNVMGDGYSLSQSQTINFTQQTLRQRSTTGANVNGIIPAAMASAGNQFGGPMNPRHMAPQNFDPKLLQQQQLLRAQAQNQQHVRPPPPDYKTTAGMMQGMQPRYSNPPSNMRRMPHQPLPAAGPMVMRPQHGMFVSQQQHMQARGMYPRQQAPMTMPMENMPQAGTIEWRQHMMMAQQQNTTYSTQMRPNYQQGFNSGVGNVGMPITHQMRMQQNMAGGTMTAVPTLQQGMSQNGMGMNSGPINHLNGMTQQQMLQLQQQQQQQQQHQQQQQMSMSTLHMQQSQSVTISNQNAQQQQQMLLGSSSANNQASMNNFSNAQANDFSLEFFDNPDAGEISAQELLSSFDQSGFLRDMLN